MNKSKISEYDYIDFLIGTQRVYSSMEAERISPHEENVPAHDAYTRQLRFFQKLIRLRRDHAIFRRAEFFEISSPDRPPSSQEILWHGLKPGQPDWSGQSRILAFLLKDIVLGDDADANFFIMLNGQPEQPALFTVPETATPGRQCVWKKIIDTSLVAPSDFVGLAKAKQIASGSQLSVAPMGCVVLQTHEEQKTR